MLDIIIKSIVYFVGLSLLSWADYGLTDDECLTCSPYKPKNGYETFNAADIDTSRVTAVDYDQMVFKVNISAKHNFCNTGFEVALIPIGVHSGSLSGGPLCGNVTFPFCKAVYYWNSTPGGSSKTKFDGKGFSITTSLIFYNGTYKSCADAFADDSGFITLNIFTNMEGYKDFPPFTSLQSAFEKIIQCNTCVETTLNELNATAYFKDFNSYTPYYCYQSWFYDQDYQKNVSVTSCNPPPYTSSFISIPQFDKTFRAVRDCSSNCSYENAIPANNNYNTVDVYEGQGILVEPQF